MFRPPYSDVGIADEFRMVDHIERFDANLELAFTVELEAARDACVDVGNTRSAEFIAAGIAKVRRDHARGHGTIDVTGRAGVGVLGLDGLAKAVGSNQGWPPETGLMPAVRS